MGGQLIPQTRVKTEKVTPVGPLFNPDYLRSTSVVLVT